jgi:hypothetical protein
MIGLVFKISSVLAEVPNEPDKSIKVASKIMQPVIDQLKNY